MALTDKYATLIQLAGQLGINLDQREEGGVLHLKGTVPSDAHRERLFEEYGRLDPGMGSGDLKLDIEVKADQETYTVQKGDTLSAVGQRHGVAWRDIFEANRDQLDDPDKIRPGQQLRMPRK
ncbi:MAG TPA: LysM peptidoglycan-binding domain-containing protein [Pyrinomonadaceae bacterium]|nr:LysM peptidoglycan-binding domain-containing protein [Pyrinomonadaceae bacterium]